MIHEEEIKINHYKVTTDTDSSYKEDFYYAPVKGEDAKRHRVDGPALVYNSKTEDMNYFEWWNEGKMVATFNSKTNLFKKSENGTFMGLQAVELPENFKGLENTLNLSDIEACTQLVMKHKETLEVSLNDKASSINNIAQLRDKLTPSSQTNDLRPD